MDFPCMALPFAYSTTDYTHVFTNASLMGNSHRLLAQRPPNVSGTRHTPPMTSTHIMATSNPPPAPDDVTQPPPIVSQMHHTLSPMAPPHMWVETAPFILRLFFFHVFVALPSFGFVSLCANVTVVQLPRSLIGLFSFSRTYLSFLV